MTRVSIIGAPNSGKSSLLNAIIGEKTSAVTDLAGTTREQIRGFTDSFEIIDTPGINKSGTLLGKHMRKSISEAVSAADIILYVLDAVTFDKGEVQKIENYRHKEIPFVVAVNKIDKLPPEKLFPKLEMLIRLDFVKSVVPVSAKSGKNVDVLVTELKKFMVESDGGLIDEDMYTDQTVRQMSAEIIREQVILNTKQEIPHGVTVIITRFIEGTPTEIHADIVCEKESHKPIIIGKGGTLLKKIGVASRVEIEKLVGEPVRLLTHVIVRPNWKNDKSFLQQSLRQ